MTDQGVTAALAARGAIRSTNGEDSYNSGTSVRRNERATRKTVGNDVAYAMTWTELKKKMTDKYCPRTEIKKLEVELWDLKGKGTDVVTVSMLVDSAITYTSVHSEARSWSIPSEDPYEEAARQLLEQAPHSPEYVPADHVPMYIPESEHPEDLVPAEDKAPTSLLPPSFLAPWIRPLSPRALEELIFPRLTRRLGRDYLLNTPHTLRELEKRVLLLGWHARQPGPTIETRLLDTERRIMTALELVNRRTDRAAVRAEIEVLRRERLAYEQESIQTRQDLARSEAHCRALEARVTVLETNACRHEWQRQAADDLAVQCIMRTQALEAGACVDTLEDTGSSS
ncbi:hypothetical protein Tco_1564402 [Tanacetum coccineum]